MFTIILYTTSGMYPVPVDVDSTHGRGQYPWTVETPVDSGNTRGVFAKAAAQGLFTKKKHFRKALMSRDLIFFWWNTFPMRHDHTNLSMKFGVDSTNTTKIGMKVA
jgi:hypothetical protein